MDRHQARLRRALARLGAPFAAAALLTMTALAALADGDARFIVRDRVVNPDVSAFTATMDVIGNGAALTPDGSGFEPIIWRAKYVAKA
ncbi:MAG: hypothetical protein AAF360_10505, partial [Pseudomonadota bacterium]